MYVCTDTDLLSKNLKNEKIFSFVQLERLLSAALAARPRSWRY